MLLVIYYMHESLEIPPTPYRAVPRMVGWFCEGYTGAGSISGSSPVVAEKRSRGCLLKAGVCLEVAYRPG